MDLNELIDRIGYIRSKANLSARKLSLAIGKNAGYIHMLETNRNFAPTFETLAAILEGKTPEEQAILIQQYNEQLAQQQQQSGQ